MDNLGGSLDFGKVAESKRLIVVPAITYQVRKNKFAPNYPAIFPKESYKVEAGDFRKLA